MVKILDGKKLSELLATELVERVKSLSVTPKLVIIQVGNLEESNTYVKNKKIFAEKIGILVEHKKYPENIAEQEIISDVFKYNADLSVHGLIVQLPMPKHLSPHNIIESIDPKKDTDALTASNTKLLFDDHAGLMPNTTKGILSLLEHYKIKIAGQKVVIVGQSTLVGKPTALAFLNRKATVTVCHKYTHNLAQETKLADILVVAAGEPNLITVEYVSPGQTVVDVGINTIDGKTIVGDVDYQNVSKVVSAITPVPGGIGPMTVASLFENLLESLFSQT